MKPKDAETPKPSIKIRPPANTIRDQLESHKRSIVIQPPTEIDREQPQKKIIIKQPKEIIDLDQFDVCEEEIAKLTRWHRIAMIRKLSNRENESDSEGNSDLDSFAGDLENLLDAEECEEEVGNYESKHDKADGVKGLKMRRRPSIARAEEENEDEAVEAAELCRLLMEDDEAERRKKKKTKVVREETGLALGLQPSFGFENTNRIKQIVSTAQPDGSYSSKEIFNKDMKEVENVIAKKGKYGKVKALTKKNDITSVGLVSKKIKISGDKVKVFKEKKSARESFVCGACGQLGHMRTNKNCPKYGEDLEAHVETADPEKAPAKIKPLDPSSQT
uniref:Zinc knuckle domain-containing protein n=1 Tax=Quercus lobata TaxID=97700 RepID=A0A7N2N598_QUELO